MAQRWTDSPSRWFDSPFGTTASLAVVALVPVLGALDYLTGTRINFVLFYLLPTSLLAWRSDRRWAILAAFSAGTGRFFADAMELRGVSGDAWIAYWNALTVATLMLAVVWLLTRLRFTLDAERSLARTDALTGVANARSFYELAQREVARSLRDQTPLTLVYIDLDDFKSVNDRLGHPEGDRLLRDVAACIQGAIRAIDAVARLGGDEFAVLLPETGSEGAKIVTEKIRALVHDLRTQKSWPVGLSLGAATFVSPPDSVDAIVRCADELMYEAKNGGKNRVVFRVCN